LPPNSLLCQITPFIGVDIWALIPDVFSVTEYLKVMEMFKMMTDGIKAIHVQEHSVLEQLTDHTVAHCDNVVTYLLLLLRSVLKFIFFWAPFRRACCLMNKLTPAQAHCVCYTYQDKTLSVPYNTTNVQNNPHDGATHCFRDRWAQSEFSHKRVEKQLLNCSISFLLLVLNLWAPNNCLIWSAIAPPRFPDSGDWACVRYVVFNFCVLNTA